MGVTNCLGFLLVFLLLLGLVGGFVLAVLSIKYQYTGRPGLLDGGIYPHRHGHLHCARPNRR